VKFLVANPFVSNSQNFLELFIPSKFSENLSKLLDVFNIAAMSLSGRQWTDFEKNALLCLMCRGVHTSGLRVPDNEPVKFGRDIVDKKKKKKRVTGTISQEKVFMDLTTSLNHACYNKDNGEDIPYHEVVKMVEHVSSRCLVAQPASVLMIL
jgi:hypothetical protein